MNRTQTGYFISLISIFLNLLLFFLKLYVGKTIDSISIVADAWHTLSDSLSSVAVIVAVKLASQKADRDHPFGHGRWEQIISLFIAFLLAVVAYDFLKDSYFRFLEKKQVTYGFLGIFVIVLSIVVKEVLAQYTFYLARKTENLSLKADAWHHRSDALSSLVVLIGIFFAHEFFWIDSVLGIIISLMLFYASYHIAEEAIVKFLGEKPSEELIINIKKIIENLYNSDFNLHHFHIHNYVTHKELTFHIKLENHLTLEEAHKIATHIEAEILKELNIHSTIHIEPLNYEHEND